MDEVEYYPKVKSSLRLPADGFLIDLPPVRSSTSSLRGVSSIVGAPDFHGASCERIGSPHALCIKRPQSINSKTYASLFIVAETLCLIYLILSSKLLPLHLQSCSFALRRADEPSCLTLA